MVGHHKRCVKRIKFHSAALVPLSLALAINPAAAQGTGLGFAAPVPGSVLPSATADGGELTDLLSDLTIYLATSGYYDSNINQSGGTLASPRQQDFVLSLSPSIQWTRGTSLWDVTLGASGSYGQPIDYSDGTTTSQAFSAAGNYHAGRLDLGGNLSQSFNEGSNRFYGASVAQTSYGLGLSAAYEISPKSSIVSSFNSSWSEPDSGLGSTENQSANVSAMWKYSPLLRFGPGLGYSNASGAYQFARTTVGPTLSANYRLSKKVSLTGVVGLDYASQGDAGSSQSVSGSLAAAYALNPLWGFNLSLSRGVNADASQSGVFRQDTGLQFGVTHRIRRVNAALGLGYVNSGYLVSTGATSPAAIDFFTSDFSLSLPFMDKKASVTVFVRYKDSASDNLAQDWNGVQTGFSLGYRF